MSEEVKECEHKFVRLDIKEYRENTGRYMTTYTRLVTFFCEKCLEQKSQKDVWETNGDDYYKAPEWVKAMRSK